MRHRDTQTRVALHVSLLYALLAAVWIVLSGLTLAVFVHDIATIEKLVVCESGLFVAVTASLLHRTLRRQTRMHEKELEARQRAEARMHESEERFSMIFQSSPVGITLSRLSDGRIVDVNSALVNMVGYSREESIGRTSREVGVWICPEDRDRFVEGIRSRGRVEGIELRIRKKSGGEGIVLGSAGLISLAGEAHLLGMGLDITERKRAEEALRSSEERFKRYFELGLIGMVLSSPTQGTLEVNDEACKMLGYERDELMHMSWAQVTHPDDLEANYAYANRLLAGEIDGYTYDKRYIRKDGKVIYGTMSAKCVRGPDGSIDYIVSLIQDITKRKEAEERLGSTLANLRKAIGGTIQAIVHVVEMRDPYTAGHQRRVADLARVIAVEMGLSPDIIEGIRIAAVIHDIGKVSVPAEILSKPGKLTQNELELIKDHPTTGYDILKDVEFPWPVAEIVYQHHERLDGSGYPRGLKGDDVLLEARIIALADVVEAIASHRPFRPAQGIDVALDEITKNKGVLYDPFVVDTCLALFLEKGYALE